MKAKQSQELTGNLIQGIFLEKRSAVCCEPRKLRKNDPRIMVRIASKVFWFTFIMTVATIIGHFL
jgi:hypothetical protein